MGVWLYNGGGVSGKMQGVFLHRTDGGRCHCRRFGFGIASKADYETALKSVAFTTPNDSNLVYDPRNFAIQSTDSDGNAGITSNVTLFLEEEQTLVATP